MRADSLYKAWRSMAVARFFHQEVQLLFVCGTITLCHLDVDSDARVKWHRPHVTVSKGKGSSLTIWLRFCCDCGPEEPGGGGPCCGAIALCGGRPALGGPFPTLMARAGPPGPDMATSSLLFYTGRWCASVTARQGKMEARCTSSSSLGAGG
jgi:hypothetical protein